MLRNGPYPWQLKQRVSGRMGHLSNDETAALLGISISLVKNDWRMAKSWLFRELTRKRPHA